MKELLILINNRYDGSMSLVKRIRLIKLELEYCSNYALAVELILNKIPNFKG